MRSILLGLSVALLAHVTHAQSCYGPDGSKLAQDGAFFSSMQPCTSGGPSTICCATNRTNSAGGDIKNGDTKDECLANGLCQNRVTTNGVESTKYFANFCTDPDWKGGKCLDICEQTRGNLGNTQVTSCNGRADGDRWCCGDSTACCGSGVGLVRLAQIFGGVVSSASSSGSMSTAISSSSTTLSSLSLSSSAASSSSSSSTPISDPATSTHKTKKKKSGLGAGPIAGIVIGALALLALLGVLLFFVLRSNKHKKAAQQNNQLQHGAGPVTEIDGNVAGPPQYNAGEKYRQAGPGVGSGNALSGGAYDGSAPAELQQPPSELPGSEATPYKAPQHVVGTEVAGAPVNAPVNAPGK